MPNLKPVFVKKSKLTVTGWLDGEVQIVPDSSGQGLIPHKFEVNDWPERGAHVTVIGYELGKGYKSFYTRSVKYNLRGFKYSQAPAWLIPLIRDAGYAGTIEEKTDD